MELLYEKQFSTPASSLRRKCKESKRKDISHFERILGNLSLETQEWIAEGVYLGQRKKTFELCCLYCREKDARSLVYVSSLVSLEAAKGPPHSA
jgi:hypothetical protein